jgi:hypothetical protein
MRIRIVICALFLLSCLAVSATAEDVLSQITVSKLTKQQFLDLHLQPIDIIEYIGEDLEIIATPANLAWLDSRGISYEIDIPDLKAHYQSRNKEALPMGGFRTYTEIVGYLEFLKSEYPTLMTDMFSIGTSLEGNDIWAVKVSDNPDVDEDEPELLYISLIHAREPAAGASLLHFMEHMLTNYGLDSEVTYLVNNRELYFVPVQNPDGYLWNEITDPSGGGLWRKNRRLNAGGSRGVDLNRNYDYKLLFDIVGYWVL